ncbi:Polyribonucleotide nucleotidyltransferase [compost metagenome]
MGKVEDGVNVGDEVVVKVVEIDPQGRINLTVKGVHEEEKAEFMATASKATAKV